MIRAALIAALALLPAAGRAEDDVWNTYGCDEARWQEWREILDEISGNQVETDDARRMLAINRRLCEDVAAGRKTWEQISEEYARERSAWTERVRARQHKRDEQSGGIVSG